MKGKKIKQILRKLFLQQLLLNYLSKKFSKNENIKFRIQGKQCVQYGQSVAKKTADFESMQNLLNYMAEFIDQFPIKSNKKFKKKKRSIVYEVKCKKGRVSV